MDATYSKHFSFDYRSLRRCIFLVYGSSRLFNTLLCINFAFTCHHPRSFDFQYIECYAFVISYWLLRGGWCELRQDFLASSCEATPSSTLLSTGVVERNNAESTYQCTEEELRVLTFIRPYKASFYAEEI